MKQEMNFTGYIDRYLEGTMENSELIWFQKELDGNVELQEDLRMQKKLNGLIVENQTICLQEQLNMIHSNLFKESEIKTSVFSEPKRNKVLYLTMGIAASCMLLTIIISKQLNTNISKNDIYNKYFEPANIGMVFRSAGNGEINDELRSAMSMYEQKNYVNAINLFEDILNKDSSRIGLNLYSGISHMEIKEYDEANKRFNKIIDQNSNAFIESAKWYLGLCYLMTDKENQAKNVFTDISKSNSYYNKDAKKILKQMN
jgi:tetratricopeptide (TPR) repeat protein